MSKEDSYTVPIKGKIGIILTGNLLEHWLEEGRLDNSDIEDYYSLKIDGNELINRLR